MKATERIFVISDLSDCAIGGIMKKLIPILLSALMLTGCTGAGKLTLTPTSISYEYKPYLESETNPPRKWSHRTNSPLFKVGFERVVTTMPSVLEPEEVWECTDVGMMDFTVTYDDKSRKHIRYWCTPSAFPECCAAVRDLVPFTEMTPEVVRSHDDDVEDE